VSKNIGLSDIGLRYFLATSCGLAAYSREKQDAWFWMLTAAAVLLLISALTGYSLVYDLMHWDTLESSDRKK
jgi:membrane-associated phospholipid phosphatase